MLETSPVLNPQLNVIELNDKHQENIEDISLTIEVLKLLKSREASTSQLANIPLIFVTLLKLKFEESDFDSLKVDIIPFVKADYNINNIDKVMFINSIEYLECDQRVPGATSYGSPSKKIDDFSKSFLFVTFTIHSIKII